MAGIFISHTSKDKPFARRLGNDLRGYGATVWIDEAEIKVGDSLIDKISDGIENADHLVALLSSSSSKSEWVRKELNIALTKEINGKKLKVLPCLLNDCEIPPFLIDKKYADFRNPENYMAARSELLAAVGLSTAYDAEDLFLDQHVFFDLMNLNDGFDSPDIKYFSAEDFGIILKRAEVFRIAVYGIEPWPDGRFYDVEVYEDYTNDPSDPKWYKKAFRKFLKRGVKSHFAATFGVPKNVLRKFVK